MKWERVNKAHISPPWSIVRYGFNFKLLCNGIQVGLYPTIDLAKKAAHDASNTRVDGSDRGSN